MFNSLRIYAIIGAVVGILAFGATSYVKGYSNCKNFVLSKLAADRIKVLKDGKEIDDNVLSADEDSLCLLLGGC